MADIATWQHLPHLTQIIYSIFAQKLIYKDEKNQFINLHADGCNIHVNLM